MASGKQLGEPVLECFALTKTYKLAGGEEVPALRGINMYEGGDVPPIRKGEFVMIRGPSGGGKTSLINVLGLLDSPTSGTVRLFGELVDYNRTDDELSELRLQKLGHILQQYNLLSTLSAYENIELPLTLLGRPARVRRLRVEQLLARVGLQDRASHLPSELSGGEQQRVAICRALANEGAQLLVLDEPTGALDARTTVSIMNLLLDLNQSQGVTMLMVTHDPSLEPYADRIIYVADGRIVSQAVNTRQSALDPETHAAYLAAAAQESEDDEDEEEAAAGGGAATLRQRGAVAAAR